MDSVCVLNQVCGYQVTENIFFNISQLTPFNVVSIL